MRRNDWGTGKETFIQIKGLQKKSCCCANLIVLLLPASDLF